MKSILLILLLSASCTKSPLVGRQVASEVRCDQLIQTIVESFSPRETELYEKIVAKTYDIMGKRMSGLTQELSDRVDDVFQSEFLNRVKKLTYDQKEELLKAINKSGRKAFRENDLLGTANSFTRKIKLHEELLEHPFSRFVFWHELDHMIFIILKGEASIEVMERSAFAAQYDLFNKVFKKADLDEIKELFSSAKNIDGPSDSGAINLDFNKLNIDLDKLSESISNTKDIYKVLREDMDQQFLSDVILALNKNQEEYISHWLENYRSKIQWERLFNNVIRSAEKNKKYFFGGILLATVASYLLAGEQE